MRRELWRILYGGIYEASPGSERYLEQCRRLEVAIKLMEEEMAKTKYPEPDEKRPDWKAKMIKKAHGEGAEGETDGV